MTQPQFVHLNVHSDFSFSLGASKVGSLVDRCAELGQPAFALTDRNVMYGSFLHSKTCVPRGVQPIIGCELQIEVEGITGWLVALAQTDRGYMNVCTLLSEANKPDADHTTARQVNWELLQKYCEDVILLSGGGQGILYNLLRGGKPDAAAATAERLAKIFGDRFYIQVARNRTDPTDDEWAVETALLQVAYNANHEITLADGTCFKGIPIVASTDIFYAVKERHDAWEVNRATELKHSLTATGESITPTTDSRYFMRSSEEMAGLFADLPEAVANTVEIARRCAFKVEGRDPILPHFDSGAGRDEAEELKHQAHEGLKRRLAKKEADEGRTLSDEDRQRYIDRLDYELGIINKMGFPGYFLIVADFIQWGKANGIPVGPGRGSGAGSLVAWSLLITNLDPFQFGLLFERFLNPERVSMPDFDVDFCEDRRGEVIQYVQDKYGMENVAQIASYGQIKSKTAIRDAARFIIHDKLGGFSQGEINTICNLIPNQDGSPEPKPVKDAFETTPELADKLQHDEKIKILYKAALDIEGLYRSQGLHAAGIVIGDRALNELLPIGWDEETGLPVCQYDMKGAEAVGMVKFDFLGLKTLSVIQRAIQLIKQYRGDEIDIDAIPMDDPKVFKMLAEGRSVGVFQFESGGMQRVLKSVKPTRIEDLIAVNALYRPGPMDMIPHFAACKNGTETPNYPEPVDQTKPFLEETFGIMIYQEQVMKVAQVVAGYSLGGADLLRRAMGKKIQAEMDKQRTIFVKGATERGTPERAANELFDTIAKFAGYGFNKSHAAAYAWIAYQTAWLKAHYPVEFFSALLTYNTHKPEKMALIKDDLEAMDIPLLPPDVQNSYGDFRPEPCEKGYEGFAVRFGLLAVKKFSGDLSRLVETREKDGPFKDLQDFYRRAGEIFNKGQLEKLAEASAFDSLYKNRRAAHSILSWLQAKVRAEKKHENQGNLFGNADYTIPESVAEVDDWGDRVDREFRAVGFYFSSHPLDPYVNRMRKAGVKRYISLLNFMKENQVQELPRRKLCGMVMNIRVKTSVRGNTYVSCLIGEREAQYWCVFFGSPDCPVEQMRDVLEAANKNRSPVVLVGDVVLEDEDLRVTGREVYDAATYFGTACGDVTVTITDKAVMEGPRERAALHELEERIERDELDEEAAKKERATLVAQSIRHRLGELKEFLSTIQNDEHQKAVGVQVRLLMDGFRPEHKRIDGLYLIDAVAENRLKSMVGVAGISEAA